MEDGYRILSPLIKRKKDSLRKWTSLMQQNTRDTRVQFLFCSFSKSVIVLMCTKQTPDQKFPKWQDRLIFVRLRIALTSILVSGYLEIHRLIEVEKMTIIFFYLFGESYLVPVWMGLAIATLNLPFKQTVEKIFRQTPLCIGDKFIYMSLIKEKCLVMYTSVYNSIESYFRNSSELITKFEHCRAKNIVISLAISWNIQSE